MRKGLIKAHLWLTLVVGLVFAFQGLTGAMFVFSREIDRYTWPVGTGGPQASLDEILETAARHADRESIYRLSVLDSHHDVVNVLYRDRAGAAHAIIVDASTAEMLGRRAMEPTSPFSGSFTRWLFWGHYSFLIGDVGKDLVGFAGIFLAIAAMTGIWIGWPKRNAWKASFDVRRWKAIDQKLFGWHRVVGIVSSFALLALSLTGIYLAFPEDPVRNFVARIMPYQPNFSGMNHGGADETAHLAVDHAHPGRQITPQHVLHIAKGVFPNARWVRVMLPTEHDRFYVVKMHQRGESRAWLGTTSVVVDPGSGRVVATYDPIKAPLSNRILDAIWSFHNGELGGVVGRVLVMLAGFALPVLYVTGVWRWLRRRKRKAAARQAPKLQSA